MATENVQRSAVSLKLDAGTIGGGTIIKSCSLGKVLAEADADKVMAVTGLLLPVLAPADCRCLK